MPILRIFIVAVLILSLAFSLPLAYAQNLSTPAKEQALKAKKDLPADAAGMGAERNYLKRKNQYE
jgi:hypothetical protein